MGPIHSVMIFVKHVSERCRKESRFCCNKMVCFSKVWVEHSSSASTSPTYLPSIYSSNSHAWGRYVSFLAWIPACYWQGRQIPLRFRYSWNPTCSLWREIHVTTTLFSGQRHVNIMRQTIGPKRGHRKCRQYKTERPSSGDVGCPDFVGDTSLGCWLPPCFLVALASGWEHTLTC